MAAGASADRAEIGLRGRREATVREHMESENRHDFDATIVVVTHSPAVAHSADRVLEIRDGRLA